MPPTGPIAMIALERGLRGQNRSALFVVAGGVIAEAGWAVLAYLGITCLISRYPVQTTLLQLTAGVLLAVFAIVTIVRRRSPATATKPHKFTGASFLLGLSVAGLNPTFLVTWGGAVAVARSIGLQLAVEDAPGFALGVASGPILWYSIVLKLLSLHRHRFRPEMLGIIAKIMPFILLAVAMILLGEAVKPLLTRF